MAKGKNEAKIKFTAETGEFNKSIKEANQEMSSLRAELKLNAAEMANTDDKASKLAERQEMLGRQLELAKQKTEALRQKLEAAKRNFGENSDEAHRLEIAVTNAQAAEQKFQTEITNCNAEIAKNSSELDDNRAKAKKLDNAVEGLTPSIEEVEEAAEEAADGFTIWGGTMANLFANGISAAVSGIGELCSTFWNLGDETRELRTNMGKVEVAFESAGFSAETAGDMYEEFYGVVADEGKATEAISHLSKLADTEEDLADWTDICTGVYAEFGDSLPIEGLAEASNETVKTGKLTGGLCDALAWAGVNEEEFQKKLDKCNTEAEREALIRETLLGIYGDSADAYRENNESIIEANKAQARYNSALAKLGEIIEPIKTAFVNGMAAIIEKVADFIQGLDFSALKSAWKYLVAMWKNQLKPAFEGLWEALKAVFEAIKPAIQPFLDFFDGLGDGKSPMERFRSSLWDIKTAVTWVTDKLNAFSDWAKEHPNTIKVITAAITALVAGFVAFKAAMAVSSAIKKVSSAIKAAKTGFAAFNAVLAANPIVLIITAIAALVAAFIYLWNNCEAFREFWINLWNKVKAYVEPIWQAISGFFVQAWEKIKAVWQYVQPYFETIWQNILVGVQFVKDQFVNVFQTAWNLIKIVWDQVVAYFSAIWESIKLVFSVVKDVFSGDFAGAWEGIKAIVGVWGEYFAQTWENIKAVFAVVVEFFSNTFSNVWAAIKGVLSNWASYFSGLWSSVEGAFSTCVEWLSGVFSDAWAGICLVWDIVSTYFSDLWTSIETTFSGVGETLSGFFSDAWTWICNTWDSVGTYFSDLWSNIKNTFSSVKTWFFSKFYSAWTSIKNVFSNWGTFFSDLWETIKSTFTDLGTKLGDAIGGAVKSGINGVLDFVEDTVNDAIDLINGAIRLVNKIPGVNIDTIGHVEIPQLASGGVARSPILAEIGEYSGAYHNPEIVTPQNIMRDTFEDVLNARLESSLSLDRLVDAINDLADRPISIAVNDRILAEATAGAYDTVSGNRLNLRERGLAL